MPGPVNNRYELLGKRKSYAFVIGINAYPEINRDLSSAVYDAKEIARALRNEQGFDHVELFLAPKQEDDAAALATDLDGIQYVDKADGASLRDLLQRIADPEQEPKINSKDCIVFYYAGHGKPGKFEEGPAGFLLPSDALPDAAMLAEQSLIAMEEVYDTLKALDCHHTLLILDCCFAGKFRFAGKGRASGWASQRGLPLYHKRFNRFVTGKAWQVLVSAGPHQPAADWVGVRFDEGQQHSPFAEALIKALRGEARVDYREEGRRLGDGVLTSGELKNYLWDVVERLTNDGQGDKDIQYPDLFPMGQHKGGQFIFFDPQVALKFAHFEERNPYKGLQSYESSDADIFFGRKNVIRELDPRIREHPLLVITGASASGKSSLVKAGLYPALRRKEETFTADELLILRPGAKPWSGSPVTDEKTGKIRHYTGLETLLPELKADKDQLLLLDQYEELFTEGATEEERRLFEEKMESLLATAKAEKLRIVISLRSDFEWQLQESTFGQSFWKTEQLNTFLYRMPPMNIDELREALVKPALAELYDFETDFLITSILDEIGHAPGALPLLNFTMSRLYQITNEELRVFTHQDYHDLGGVNGALSQYADEVHGDLSPDQQEVMRKLLLRMVKVIDGGYGRRRVYVKPGAFFTHNRKRSFVNEFDYPDHQDGMVAEVLRILEEKQLIVGGHDIVGSYYEPVHDALIQHWKTARQWIKDFGAENLTLQRQLWQAVLDSTAKSEEDEKKKADSLLQFSKLWDSNPKLVQVIEHVALAAKPVLLEKKKEVLEEAIPDMPIEEIGPFSEFWEQCLKSEDIPDLNTLVLSGFSDNLLDIMMRHAPHWLNEAEVAFIRQSWGRRIQSVLELKAQKEQVVNELMSSTWRGATFLDDDDFGYWKGVRDTYNNVKILIDLKKAKSISPVPVFLSGPHEDDFNKDSNEFGHYNPKFLDWVIKYAIPAERDSILRRLTMPFYTKFLQVHIRNFYNVYKYHEKNSQVLATQIAAYHKQTDSGHPVTNTFQFYISDAGSADAPVIIPEERQFGEEMFANVAGSFWFRRNLDETAPYFRDILVKLLRTYDPHWLEATDQIWKDPEAYRASQQEKNKSLLDNTTQIVDRAANNAELWSLRDSPYLRGLYGVCKSYFSLKIVQKLSPVPVFIGGPHGEEFNLKSQDFGHYNPEFLKWMKNKAFPYAQSPALSKALEILYDKVICQLVRTHYQACTFLDQRPTERDDLIAEYRSTLKDLASTGGEYSAYEFLEYGTPTDSIMRKAEPAMKEAIMFWLRRYMDGTAPQLKDMLQLLLQTYDHEWLTQQNT